MASSPIRPDQAVLNVSYNSIAVSQQCSVYDAQMQNSIGSWEIGDLRLLVTGVTTSNYPVVIVYDSKNYNYTIPAGGTSYTVTLDEITPFVSYRDKINIGGVEADLHDARISSIDSTPTSGSTNLVTSGGVYTGLSGKADSSSVHSIPNGGTTGQVLKKISGTDYDVEWANESGGGGISTITLTFTPNEGETYFGTKEQAATALGITTNEVDSLMAGDYDRLIFNGLYADKSTPGQVASDAAYQRYVAADYNGVPYSLFLIYEDGGYACWWKRQVPALSTSIYNDGSSNAKAATPKAVKDYVDELPIPRVLGLFQFTPTESSSFISLGNAAAAATALSISESQLEMLYEGSYNEVVLRDRVEGKICIGSESLVNSNTTGISYEIMSGDVTPHMLEFLYESSVYKYRYYQIQGGSADAVLYTAQTLTTSQQTQARTNIAAEGTANKVTSISAASTDAQYPSAKCMWDLIGDVETLINAL